MTLRLAWLPYLAACLLTACGDSSTQPELAPPVAAPACPPGVNRVIDMEQLFDADRANGGVAPDLGRLPRRSAFAGDPAEPGTFVVLQERFGVPRPDGDTGASNATVYIPALDERTPAPGPFPLVLVMPGFGASHTGYLAYSTLFASHGFVVLGLDTDDGGFVLESDHELEARRVLAAIDWMLGESAMAERIDATKIAAAGHSKGGKVAFWAAALDPRIDLVIGWDPSNAGGAPCFIDPERCNAQPAAPNCNTPDGEGQEARSGVLHLMHAESLILGVAPDPLTNPDPAHNALNFYRGAPSPTTYVGLAGGHLGFLSGNQALRSAAIRASAGRLLELFQNQTVAAEFRPGGTHFDPDGVLEPAVRNK